MRKYVLTSIVVLPLLLNYSHAAQYGSSPTDPEKTWIFSSEDSGTSAYLGVDIADVTGERLSALKLKEEKGVEVTMVDQDAPAGKAGIKEHDVILSMNGTAIESGAQLRRMIHETPAGRVVTFGLSRDGQPLTVKVQLGNRHSNAWPMPMPNPNVHVEIPDIHVQVPDIDIPGMLVMTTVSARSGLTVENITSQLGEFFGVKGGNGVLVRSVEKGSRAERAGFRAGDVIVKINDQPVHDTSDFTHAVRSRNGNSISVGLVREKKEQNLNLTMPERRDSSYLFDEESFDEEPLFKADSMLELSELQSEIAKMEPQIAVAKEKAIESSRKAMDEVRKSLCEAQKESRRQFQRDQEDFRKQQQGAQRELRKQLEQLRQSVRNWADI